MNPKTLKVPIKEWQANIPNQSKFSDQPHAVLLNFLPGDRRSLSPQGLGCSYWIIIRMARNSRTGNVTGWIVSKFVGIRATSVTFMFAILMIANSAPSSAVRDGKDPSHSGEHRRDRRKKRAENQAYANTKVAIPREIDAIVGAARKNKPRHAHKMRKSEAAAGHRTSPLSRRQGPEALSEHGRPQTPPAPAPARTKRILPLDEW